MPPKWGRPQRQHGRRHAAIGPWDSVTALILAKCTCRTLHRQSQWGAQLLEQRTSLSGVRTVTLCFE